MSKYWNAIFNILILIRRKKYGYHFMRFIMDIATFLCNVSVMCFLQWNIKLEIIFFYKPDNILCKRNVF